MMGCSQGGGLSHHCAALLLHPLFRGLCQPRCFSSPFWVSFLCFGLLDMASGQTLVPRSHGEEEVMWDRRRPDRHVREERCRTALFFSSSTQDGHNTDRHTASQAVFKQCSPSQGLQMCRVVWGGGEQQAGLGSPQLWVVLVVSLTAVEWPRSVLSQSSSSFPVLQHGEVSWPEVAAYPFCVLAARVASI